MTRRFFTAGTMPSDDLLPRFDRDLELERHWRVSRHALRAHRRGVARAAGREPQPRSSGSSAAPAPPSGASFFLACAGLWGYRGGREWLVSHYLFARRSGSQRET